MKDIISRRIPAGIQQVSLFSVLAALWILVLNYLERRPWVVNLLLNHFLWKKNCPWNPIVILYDVWILAAPVNGKRDFLYRSLNGILYRLFFSLHFVILNSNNLRILGLHLDFFKSTYICGFLNMVLYKFSSASN